MNQDQRIFKKMMALLTKANLQGRRHAICWDFSGGRTESSRELTNGEMTAIIETLEKGFKELDRCDVMRKKIISMAHEMGWHSATNQLRRGEMVYKADMQRINNWCIKYGQYHKCLNAHSYGELVQLLSQFEQFYKSFLQKL